MEFKVSQIALLLSDTVEGNSYTVVNSLTKIDHRNPDVPAFSIGEYKKILCDA